MSTPPSTSSGALPVAGPARRARATLALLLVSLIWGGTFLWMKQAMEAVTRVLGPGGATSGSALFLTLRFALAALLLWSLVPRARVRAPGAARGGAWLGALLVGGFLLQMVGLADVTPAVSAFLTSLYVLFLAGLTVALERKRPRFGLLAGAVLATAGAGLVRGRPEIARWSAGEGLTVLAALFFAVHIVATDRVTRRVEPYRVTCSMFAWVALGGALVLAAQVGRGAAPGVDALLELLAQRDFLVPLVLNATLASVVALTLMNVFQREIEPVRAGILYALEPIWASLFGVAAGEDRFTGWLVVGGGLLLAGNLFAELLGARARER